MAGKITSADVRRLIRERFKKERGRYVVADEVSNATGLEAKRRIDMVVMACYPSDGYRIEGIEIKVDAADLRRELENVQKHGVFFDDLTHFSLAAPAEIIKMNLIPEKWGVWEIREKDGELSLWRRRKPLALRGADEDDGRIGRGFAASLVRRVLEADVRPDDLRAERDAAFREGERHGKACSDYEIRRLEKKIEAQEEELAGFRERWGLDNMEGPWSLDEMALKLRAVEGLPCRYQTYRLDNAIELLGAVQDALKAAYSQDEISDSATDRD